MLANITSHLQGSDNVQTAFIVLIYSFAAMLALGGIGGFISSFKTKTKIVHDYD